MHDVHVYMRTYTTLYMYDIQHAYYNIIHTFACAYVCIYVCVYVGACACMHVRTYMHVCSINTYTYMTTLLLVFDREANIYYTRKNAKLSRHKSPPCESSQLLSFR